MKWTLSISFQMEKILVQNVYIYNLFIYLFLDMPQNYIKVMKVM